MIDDPTLIFPDKSRFRHETRDENGEHKAQDKTRQKTRARALGQPASLSRAVTLPPANHASSWSLSFLHMSAFCYQTCPILIEDLGKHVKIEVYSTNGLIVRHSTIQHRPRCQSAQPPTQQSCPSKARQGKASIPMYFAPNPEVSQDGASPAEI